MAFDLDKENGFSWLGHYDISVDDLLSGIPREKKSEQAGDMFLRLVKQMSERNGVSEQLKTENQMEWVGRMNNIGSRAMEIVYSTMIYDFQVQICTLTILSWIA